MKQAVGVTGNLRRVFRRELRRNGHAVRLNQGQEFTAGIETEARVQARRGAVFAGGEHDEVAVRRQIDGRESPFGKIGRVVREEPANEIEGVRAGVMDFDPIGVIAVLVRYHTVSGRHEFGNDRLGGQNKRCGEQKKPLDTERQGAAIRGTPRSCPGPARSAVPRFESAACRSGRLFEMSARL